MAAIDRTGDDNYTICWGRGDTKRKVFTIKDGNGNALDVSGSSFILSVNTLKSPPDGTTLQFAIASAFVNGGTDGQIYFAPAPGDTDLPSGNYFYDLQETDVNTEVDTLYKARCLIVQDISK